MNPTAPPFLPPAIQTLKQICPVCGNQVSPDFWHKSNEPFVPIYPKGTKGEKGAWIQVTVTVPCACGQKIDFDSNYKKLDNPVFFYGDDADRKIGKFHLHSYSLIGGTSGPIHDISEALSAVKAKHVPSIEPSSWRIHTTKMLNARKRILDEAYRDFTHDKLILFFRECAEILKKWENMTWNMHVTAVIRDGQTKRERKQISNHAKVTAHHALLSFCIYLATRQGLRPMFTLDASKPVKMYPHIEEWSYDSHLGSKHYLGYAFLSHSNDIAAPKLVLPGSHPCLELADVHAYFAANSMYRKANKQEPEIPLNCFGKFRYLVVNNDNMVNHVLDDDIPRAYFSS